MLETYLAHPSAIRRLSTHLSFYLPIYLPVYQLIPCFRIHHCISIRFYKYTIMQPQGPKLFLATSTMSSLFRCPSAACGPLTFASFSISSVKSSLDTKRPDRLHQQWGEAQTGTKDPRQRKKHAAHTDSHHKKSQTMLFVEGLLLFFLLDISS